MPSRVRSVHLVALCVVVSLVLRIPFVTSEPMPDEAGMLLIARSWHEGPYLYGDYFVGRGLVAIGFYAVGNALGGLLGIRLLACLVAATMVAAAGWSGHQLRGRAGAGWAALVAAAYTSTYAFASQVMNERLLASTLVMVSCGLTLAAVRRRSVVLAAGAGVAATLPMLVVQSHVDGYVFALVVITASAVMRRLSTAEAVRLALGGLAGIAAALSALALLLATTWMTFDQWWFQMFGYRVAASLVVGEDTTAPEQRLRTLMSMAVWTGIYLLVLALAGGLRRLLRRGEHVPVWLACMTMLALSLASMYAGGDYWSDYLLQPLPALAMGAALVAPSFSLSGVAMRLGTALAVGAAVYATYLGLADPIYGSPDNEAAAGRWLAAQKQPGDTVVVVYGRASVVYASGMESPYPFLWSLLTRTLDPDVEQLASLMEGPDAPTWVVQWSDPNTWGLDADGRVRAALRERYIQVASPCRAPIYVLTADLRRLDRSVGC